MTKPAWGEVGIGIGTILLAAIVGWETSLIPGGAIYAKVGPKVIPWVVTGMLAVLGAILVLEGLRGGNLDQGGEDEHGPLDIKGLFWLLAGLALNVGLIDLAGFIIASTAMFVCTARAFGSTKIVRDAAIGFAVAVAAYVGFDRVLGYQIGSGLIERFL